MRCYQLAIGIQIFINLVFNNSTMNRLPNLESIGFQGWGLKIEQKKEISSSQTLYYVTNWYPVAVSAVRIFLVYL